MKLPRAKEKKMYYIWDNQKGKRYSNNCAHSLLRKQLEILRQRYPNRYELREFIDYREGG